MVDAEAVMRYIRQLTETGVRLRERVRLLEDEVDDLREGMQVERHARVCWFSTALQEATNNLHDYGRKRQRPSEPTSLFIILTAPKVAFDKTPW